MLKVVGILALCFFAVSFADDERVPSACEEDRARRLNSTVTESILHIIPECKPNGDYAALQCFTSNNYCVCFRRNGQKITSFSKNIKACKCIREWDDAITSKDDYIPRCDKNGYYNAKQCKGDECWCVDKSGNIINNPQTGKVYC